MRRRTALVSAVLVTAALQPAGGAGAAAAADPAPRVERGHQGHSCTTDPDAPKRQLRGDWIASVSNIDWPSRPGLTPAQQRAELTGWYDDAVAKGLNAVVLQVRPTADTFWPSDLEPWSHWLTGTEGQDPGWDPMAYAVREAHARNLELHAWFNPYRVSQDTDRSALAPDSPAALHPDWVVEYGGKLYYDPGLPQVRRLTEDVVMEVVRRYDIDAVHFDDYFYPYPVAGQAFPDDDTFAAYGGDYPGTTEGRADWRRHNTDLLVHELSDRIHAAKPWVKLGVSPFGVWRNVATDPEGSDTTAGAQTYDDLYADTRRWVREEWLDYVAPQVYWSIGFAPADYAVLVPWWAEQVAGTDVQLYVGQATYKVGTSTQSPEWSDPTEMSRHLSLNQQQDGAVQGDLYFSAKDVRADRLDHWEVLRADHYAHPALVPVTAGVPGHAPAPVHRLRVVRRAGSTEVSWRGRATSYAVYRVPGRVHGRDLRCATADATHLVGTVRGERWSDPTAPDGAVTYVVTALDRAYRESRPAARAIRSR